MRALVPILLIIAAPLDAQTAPAGSSPAVPPGELPAAPTLPATTPAQDVWDPVRPYISTGQDEAGYRTWYTADPLRAGQVKAFYDYLANAQVAGIVPTWQLLRTATAWKDCGSQPFEVPPSSAWPHMIDTLRYIRDYVIPAVGPVEPVSAYRNPSLNLCAGGAPESAHKLDSAVDLVPLRPITREVLMRTLCAIHSEHGAAYNAGLGFYAYLRFHIDSTKFRRWNMDPAVAADCPPIIHAGDAASVGQPLPAPAAAESVPVAATAAAPDGSAPPTASPAPKH